MTDDDAIAAGYAYKVWARRGYLYARTAAEANAIQRALHSHYDEAPEVEVVRAEPTAADAIMLSAVRRG